MIAWPCIICDPLSENPTSLHFCQTPFLFSLLSMAKNQWTGKLQPYLMDAFRVIALAKKAINEMLL